jgi:hypothetical protein
MRTLALLSTFILLLPLSASAQDAPAAQDPAAPLTSECAADTAPDAGAGDLGLYVGVGLGSNLSLGGGSFGYQLEASVGMFYKALAVEILGGSTTANGTSVSSVGPHIGGAVRVQLYSSDVAGLQLGAGLRYHQGRSPNGDDERYTGGFTALRLLLPLTDNVAVRIGAEYERLFGSPGQGLTANRLMLGFGVETRVSP